MGVEFLWKGHRLNCQLIKMLVICYFIAEVTGKAIEETAAVVLRLYQDRKHKCSMPRISKRY